ncbi:hypothetical protein GGF32_005333 [Allomyces javanicus]|nr:hypothetical protein GGF32_005333 [Allomyces javanicus]
MPDKGVGMTPGAVDIESFLRYDPHRPRNVLLNADGTPYVSPDLSNQLPDLPDCQTLIDVSREKIRRQDMPSVATSYRFDIQGPSRASPAALFGRDTRQEIKDAYKIEINPLVVAVLFIVAGFLYLEHRLSGLVRHVKHQQQIIHALVDRMVPAAAPPQKSPAVEHFADLVPSEQDMQAASGWYLNKHKASPDTSDPDFDGWGGDDTLAAVSF